MRQRERQPLAEVASILPSAACRTWGAIPVEDAIIEVTGVMHTEDRATAALRLEEDEMAEDKAIVDVIANGKRGYGQVPMPRAAPPWPSCSEALRAASFTSAEIVASFSGENSPSGKVRLMAAAGLASWPPTPAASTQ